MLAIMLALEARGYLISVPFGENSRYDLVVDDGSDLARVQCKTGRLRRGAVHFSTCSTYGHHPRPVQTRRDYHGQIDYFAVYCSETRDVYLVPIGDLRVRVQASLRLEPSRNGQKKYIRRATAYWIGTVGLRANTKPPASAGGR